MGSRLTCGFTIVLILMVLIAIPLGSYPLHLAVRPPGHRRVAAVDIHLQMKAPGFTEPEFSVETNRAHLEMQRPGPIDWLLDLQAAL